MANTCHTWRWARSVLLKRSNLASSKYHRTTAEIQCFAWDQIILNQILHLTTPISPLFLVQNFLHKQGRSTWKTSKMICLVSRKKVCPTMMWWVCSPYIQVMRSVGLSSIYVSLKSSVGKCSGGSTPQRLAGAPLWGSRYLTLCTVLSHGSTCCFLQTANP